MRLVCIIAATLCIATVHAAESPIAGLRWGMSVDAVAAVLGARTQHLDPPIDYGAGQARLFAKGVMLGGTAMTAFYQFDGEGRLRQALLERRDAGSTPKAFTAIERSLRQALGKPAVTCEKQRGSPRTAERRWSAGATSVHLTFMDFTGAAMTLDPSKDVFNPGVPSTEYETFKRRAFPRRIVLRYFPAAEKDLAGPAPCA